MFIFVAQPDMHRLFQFKVKAGLSGAVLEMALQIVVGHRPLCLTDGVQIVLTGNLVNLTVQKKNLSVTVADVVDGMAAVPGGEILGQLDAAGRPSRPRAHSA